MKVLLIGGTGTLSSDSTRLCIEKGFDVFLFNRGNRNIFKGDNLHYLIGDINNVSSAQSALADMKFDVVVDYITFNVETLKSRIQLFGDRCKQYVFISTATVFKNVDSIISEDSPKGNDAWEYSKNKLLCEKYLIDNADSLGFKYTIVRPYITYDDRRIPFPVVTKKYYWSLINRVYSGKPILMCDDGQATLTLTHTLDFAVGIVGLFGNEQAVNEDFNIVGDTTGTWNDIVSIIEKYTKKKAIIINVERNKLADAFLSQRIELLYDKSNSHVFDNSKIKQAVPEFNTSWNLEAGLFHSLDYLHKDQSLQKIDKYWDNTVDVLCAKFDVQRRYTVSLKQKMVYYLQENQYLRVLGRAARKAGIWRF